MAPPNGLKPCLRDHEFHILRRELRGHQNHKSSFSQLCKEVKKILKKYLKHLIIWPYWPRPWVLTPNQRAMNCVFHSLGR